MIIDDVISVLPFGKSMHSLDQPSFVGGVAILLLQSWSDKVACPSNVSAKFGQMLIPGSSSTIVCHLLPNYKWLLHRTEVV